MKRQDINGRRMRAGESGREKRRSGRRTKDEGKKKNDDARPDSEDHRLAAGLVRPRPVGYPRLSQHSIISQGYDCYYSRIVVL